MVIGDSLDEARERTLVGVLIGVGRVAAATAARIRGYISTVDCF